MEISCASRSRCRSQSEWLDGGLVLSAPLLTSPRLPHHRRHDLDKQSMFTTPIQFYDFFLNRVVVAFKPKFDDPEPKPEFEISLSKKNSYDQVRQSTEASR